MFLPYASESSEAQTLHITCPLCHSAKYRRSKRRSLTDYLFSCAGIVPWRCEQCNARFHARYVPFRFSLYAHCAYCGNANLQRIAPEYVPGVLSFLGRLLALPSLRCDPCRHKFFSLRPPLPQEHSALHSVDL
jgi:hypothetical protein